MSDNKMNTGKKIMFYTWSVITALFAGTVLFLVLTSNDVGRVLIACFMMIYCFVLSWSLVD